MTNPDIPDRPATPDTRVDDQKPNRGRLWPCFSISLFGAASYHLWRPHGLRRMGPKLPRLELATLLSYAYASAPVLFIPLVALLGDRHARRLVVAALGMLACVVASELLAHSDPRVFVAQRLTGTAVEGLLPVVLGAVVLRALSVHNALVALLGLEVLHLAGHHSAKLINWRLSVSDASFASGASLGLAATTALLAMGLWIWRRPPEPLAADDPREDPLVGPPLSAAHGGLLVLLLGAVLGLAALARQRLDLLAVGIYGTGKRTRDQIDTILLRFGGNVALLIAARERRWRPRRVVLACACVAALAMLAFALVLTSTATMNADIYSMGMLALGLASGELFKFASAALLRQSVPAARLVFWYSVLTGTSWLVKSVGLLPLSDTVALVGAGVVALLLVGALHRTSAER